MDSIEEYFQGEYIQERNKITEIEELVNGVIKTLTDRTDPNGWPYKLSNSNEYNKVTNYSSSTNSMILFVLAKLKGSINNNSSLLPGIEWDYCKDLKNTIKKTLTDSIFESYLNELISTLSTNINDQHIYIDEDGTPKNKKHLVHSNTFGANDPFTLSWISELMSGNDFFLPEIKDNFNTISKDIIIKSFLNPSSSILDFNEVNSIEDKSLKNKRFPSNHIFPLLRTIHLFRSIKTDLKLISTQKTDLELINTQTVLVDLHNRINQQISHYTIQNSLFDTAELVMSLEGILLLDENRRIDENLTRKVFEILETNQKNNLNWRPLKPFVTSPQGDVLLPLSIEIANSLLRVCKLLETSKIYYFHEYANIFNKYTQWLLANVSQCTIDKTVYKGWRSEHVQEADVIHPWETAQVLTYLMTYKSMIQERIAYKSLKKSGLSCSDKFLNSKMDEEKWINKWEKSSSGTKVYTEIRENYISRKKNNDVGFSMLLFGPPGTGKTAIGEDIAEVLNRRLITITPSDFIKNGEADVEGRAKSIFKTLEQQKDCVILFDEIDRLILDRDSIYYNNQGDMFQFMTPSMLVKIKDLRKAEKCIFIIATNYAERIDSAIKRAGRIDHKYLINLPNLDQRKKILTEQIATYISQSTINSITESVNGDIYERNNAIIDGRIKDEKIIKEFKNSVSDYLLQLPKDSTTVGDILYKRTVFYAFGELDTLAKSACKSITNISDFVENFLEAFSKQDKPAVRLTSYGHRFQKNERGVNLPIYPYKEFFNLLDLLLEVSPIDLSSNDDDLKKTPYKNIAKTIQEVVELDNFELSDYNDLKCYQVLKFFKDAKDAKDAKEAVENT